MLKSLAVLSHSMFYSAAFSAVLPVAYLWRGLTDDRTVELMNPFNLVGSVRTSTAKSARTAENDKASIAAFVKNRARQTQNIR